MYRELVQHAIGFVDEAAGISEYVIINYFQTAGYSEPLVINYDKERDVLSFSFIICGVHLQHISPLENPYIRQLRITTAEMSPRRLPCGQMPASTSMPVRRHPADASIQDPRPLLSRPR